MATRGSKGDMVLAADAEGALDDLDVRPRERGIDIPAARPLPPRRHCRARARAFEEDFIVAPFLVHERASGRSASSMVSTGASGSSSSSIAAMAARACSSVSAAIAAMGSPMIANDVPGKQRMIGNADTEKAWRIGWPVAAARTPGILKAAG